MATPAKAVPGIHLGLSFSADAAIQAGLPLSFSFELTRIGVRFGDSVGTSATVTLTINGIEIWSSTVPIFSTPTGEIYSEEDTGLIQETLNLDPNSRAASVLYLAGAKTLVLTLVGNGAHHNPFTAQANLTVGPASAGMEWEWSDPTPMTVAWKSAYSLTGSFLNMSTAPLTVLRATLVENGVTDMTTNQLQTLDLGPVSIRTSTGTVAFNQITQSWQWFDDVTFIMNLPPNFTKSFAYQVQLDAQDLWGNEYQLASSLKSVSVFIPQSKITDCGLAATSAGMAANFLAAAAATAAVAAGTPPPADIPIFEAAAGLFGAAGAAYATAQVLGAAAKDPPAADPLYKESVQKKAVEIPAALSGNQLADALATFYRQVLDIAANHEALSVIHGRILGALNAKDRSALDRQVTSHREIVADMQQGALRLPEATARAIQMMQAEPLLDASKISKVLSEWKRFGIPQEVKTSKAAKNLPQAVFSSLDRVIREVPIESLTAPLAQGLASVGLGAANWAAEPVAHSGFLPA